MTEPTVERQWFLPKESDTTLTYQVPSSKPVAPIGSQIFDISIPVPDSPRSSTYIAMRDMSQVGKKTEGEKKSPSGVKRRHP